MMTYTTPGTTHKGPDGRNFHERKDGQFLESIKGMWHPSPAANRGEIDLKPLRKTAHSATNCAHLPVTKEEDEAWDLKTMPHKSARAMKAYRDQTGPWAKGEERMDQIGRNGNDGIHYDAPLLSDEECEALQSTGRTSAHYRHSYKGIKLDPYRIALIYDMRGGPREQIMKKCLRFTDKGQTEQQVVNEISDALDRWQAMLLEDGE